MLLVMIFYFHKFQVAKRTFRWIKQATLFKQCKCNRDRRRDKPVNVFVQESGCLAPVVFGCVFAEVDVTRTIKPNLCDYLHLTGAWFSFEYSYSEDP